MEEQALLPGLAPGQIYTYPARCWRKKRRLNILEDPRLRPCEFKIDCDAVLKKESSLPEGPVLESLLSAETLDKKVETKEEESMSECQLCSCPVLADCDAVLKKESSLPEGPVLESLLSAETLDKKVETKEEESMSECQKLLVGDFPHELEMEELEDDIPKRKNKTKGRACGIGGMRLVGDFPHELEMEELEDDIPKRKNKTKGRACGIGGMRKRQEPASLEDRDKPYVCDICGKRYKNRPGLSYHYTHTHLADEEGEEDSERHTLPFHRKNNHKLLVFICMQKKSQWGSTFAPQGGIFWVGLVTDWVMPSNRDFLDCDLVEIGFDQTAVLSVYTKKAPDGSVIPNGYCDFCLGGSKKTGCPEDLISCADCGRSGHPSCLQFTVNMTAVLISYFLCIECKSCSLCGTSENDNA
ncbi:UNVERIFIED_CONTAM: hypothetical protein FKN15_013301 [Acipenser sinensis]